MSVYTLWSFAMYATTCYTSILHPMVSLIFAKSVDIRSRSTAPSYPLSYSSSPSRRCRSTDTPSLIPLFLELLRFLVRRRDAKTNIYRPTSFITGTIMPISSTFSFVQNATFYGNPLKIDIK